MVDTEMLWRALRHYKHCAPPSNGNATAPCTIGELNAVIEKTAEMFSTIITALEQEQSR
ncbi:MAG: hypothetical protein LIO54_03490 [Oscillospiraceae bacterium]|nr:hypothetical protein [Oscillospiraceae bacterium]